MDLYRRKDLSFVQQMSFKLDFLVKISSIQFVIFNSLMEPNQLRLELRFVVSAAHVRLVATQKMYL